MIGLLIPTLLALLTIFLETLRLWGVLRIQGIAYDLPNLYLVNLSSKFLGKVTPASMGEFIKIFYIKQDKETSLGLALSGAVVDKVMENLATFILGGVSILIFFNIDKRYLIFLIGSLTFGFLLLLSLNRKFHYFVSNKLSFFKVLKEYESGYDKLVDDYHYGLSKLKEKRTILPFFASFLPLLVFSINGYLMMGFLGIKVGYKFAFVLLMIFKFTEYFIGFTFAGLGAKDVALAFLLKKFAIPTSNAVSLSVLNLLTCYIAVAITGYVSWNIKPLRI